MGPRASTFTKYWICLDIFSWYLCRRSSSRVFFLLPPNRRTRIFSPACNMSSLSDANQKILNKFRNSWFFKHFCNTVRDPTECNLDVISQSLKVCIASCKCVNSSLPGLLDINSHFTGIGIQMHGGKCTGWWSDGLNCKRRRIRVGVFSKKCHWTGVCDS